MQRHEFRVRKEKSYFKTKYYWVPVMYCDCDIGQKKGHITKTHKLFYTILPDRLIPYKQYSAGIIEEYICDEDKEAQEDMSVLTPISWRKEFKEKTLPNESSNISTIKTIPKSFVTLNCCSSSCIIISKAVPPIRT